MSHNYRVGWWHPETAESSALGSLSYVRLTIFVAAELSVKLTAIVSTVSETG